MNAYRIEYTDTFSGEANYSWVQRATFNAPDNAPNSLLVRRGKRALGLSGRHVTATFGDTIELRFPGENTIAFISPKE